MNKLIKNNKAMTTNTTVWVILVIVLIFISFAIATSKGALFNSLIGISD